ncbi:MAG: DUF4405 domain-containing protein [Sideroxyarcus sp.]
MKVQRSWVTPITAGAFLLSGVTGILIFFHLESGTGKFMHEWLGWVLLGGAALHVVANYAGLKSHLATLRGQLLVGIFAVALLVSFIPLGGGQDEPPFMPPIRALSQVPLSTLAQVAQVTPEQLREKLSQAGYQSTSDQQSLSELVGTDTRKQMHVMESIFTVVK